MNGNDVGQPVAEVRVKPAVGVDRPTARSRETGDKGAVDPLSVAEWRTPEKASPAEFDLATGGRRLGAGRSTSSPYEPVAQP